eukprot:1154210-Pelagomonas_calceolata.AAC.8
MLGLHSLSAVIDAWPSWMRVSAPSVQQAEQPDHLLVGQISMEQYNLPRYVFVPPASSKPSSQTTCLKVIPMLQYNLPRCVFVPPASRQCKQRITRQWVRQCQCAWAMPMLEQYLCSALPVPKQCLARHRCPTGIVCEQCQYSSGMSVLNSSASQASCVSNANTRAECLCSIAVPLRHRV